MPKHPNLVLDNLDDRSELHRLLERLPPRVRVEFLADCCRQATLPGFGTHPGVAKKTRDLIPLAERDPSADRRLSLDVYFDLWMLAVQYDFDLVAAADRLVNWVRRGGRSFASGSRPGPVSAHTPCN